MVAVAAAVAPAPWRGPAAGGRRRRPRPLAALAVTAIVAAGVTFAATAAASTFLGGIGTLRSTSAAGGRTGGHTSVAAVSSEQIAEEESLGRRSAVGAASWAAAAFGGEQGASAREPKITAKCAFDIRIGLDSSVQPQRVVIGLFGEDAPVLTKNFLDACAGRVPGEAGQSARYQLATARSISQNRLISFADFVGGNYLFRRTAPSRGGMVKEEKIPLAGPDTKTDEANDLRHDTVGRVSMPKGGGTYNFLISPVANGAFLDKNNVVVGQVLEGLDCVEAMNAVKTTPKGGILNAASGRGPDDKVGAQAKEGADDYLNQPLQKVKIVRSKVLEP